jgi:hypothetical protein
VRNGLDVDLFRATQRAALGGRGSEGGADSCERHGLYFESEPARRKIVGYGDRNVMAKSSMASVEAFGGPVNPHLAGAR